jgi:hypothetical protein
MMINIHGIVMDPERKNTGAYPSSSSGSPGFRHIKYHIPTVTVTIAITHIARESGSAEIPVDREPAAISPFRPGRKVSDIPT